MNEDKSTAMLKQTFNAVADGYDSNLQFFPESAGLLCAYLNLRGDENVLDVAAGTGNAAFAIAGCLPNGRVTGVDFSSGMLDRARNKAAIMQHRNVEFIEGDMRNLEFAADSFDVAVCAFGLFFVDDMETQLSHIMRVVKPGGHIAITSFEESYFEPLKSMMNNRLPDAVKTIKSSQTWKHIATAAKCREFFRKAGLQDVRVEQANVGYYLDTAQDWWDVIWNAGFRRLVSQLEADDLERFKREHLQEVDDLKTANGIWLDVPVLFTIGVKA